MKTTLSTILCGLCLAGLLAGAGCARRAVALPPPVAVAPAPAAPPAGPAEPQPSEPPPAPRMEIVGDAPAAGYVWMPGVWQWRGQWVWAGGHWALAPRADATWVPGHWAQEGKTWTWTDGYWR